MQLCLAVELAPGNATLRADRWALWIDVNAFQERQVDHHPAVDRGSAGDVVTTAADRDLEAELFRQGDGSNDIGDPAASRDQGGALVHETVVDFSSAFVSRIGRLQQLAAEARGKLGCGAGNGRYRHGVVPSRSATSLVFHLRPGRCKREDFSFR